MELPVESLVKLPVKSQIDLSVDSPVVVSKQDWQFCLIVPVNIVDSAQTLH